MTLDLAIIFCIWHQKHKQQMKKNELDYFKIEVKVEKN